MAPFLIDVSIDFEQSHLYFPRIIVGILIILLIAIAIVHLPKKISQYKSGNRTKFFAENFHKFKLIATIGLLMIYFKSMEVVGSFFPNMGYGFLFTSIVFMLLISLLFLEGITKRKVIGVVINSIATPTLAWFVFGFIFHITLP